MTSRFLDLWRQDLSAKAAAFSAGDAFVAAEARPLPSPELIRRINAVEKGAHPVFLRSGAGDLLAIVEAIADAVTQSGASFPERPAIMELGCGVGRLLRHGPPTAPARMVATDIDPISLDWCRANLPEAAEYHLHEVVPPIASLPAMSFDIIYAHSVFTHIPLERQVAWLEEMRRLLRPGGLLAATFLSRAQQDTLLSAEQRAAVQAGGAIQIIPNWNGGETPYAYGAVCQTVAHQESRLGSVLEVCGRKERSERQDVVVARRPPDPV